LWCITPQRGAGYSRSPDICTDKRPALSDT
jgi:hypothetical protein